jgi:predicted nucleotidyltransferase
MLDSVLLGKTRAAILRELFLNPDRRISFNELVRRAHSGAGAISRELERLLEAGLVTEEREGNQRFLSAAQGSPIYAELKSLISKCSGAALVLREALEEIERQIFVAFIYGSVATGVEREDSDIDLFVVGSAGYSIVTEYVRRVENRLGRPVRVLHFDENSSTDRKSLRNPSMKKILLGTKLFVLGNDERLMQLL